jgi:hypothetical protein
LLKNPEFVIPNKVCELRNLSFPGILLAVRDTGSPMLALRTSEEIS